ncbi:Uncharacterised protein [Enterobacter hormaechei]|nr:Uncharacterised protein [Enterobacter hormaechei]
MRQHQVAIELAAVGINHGKGTARRIGGGNGRGNSHRHVHKVRQRFGGIQRFSAPDTQHRQAVGTVGLFFQAIDFILRTFAAKRCNFGMESGFFKTLTQGFFGKTQHKFIAYHQPASRQRLQVVAETSKNISALDVLPRRLNDTVHNISPLEVEVTKRVFPVLLELLYG